MYDGLVTLVWWTGIGNWNRIARRIWNPEKGLFVSLRSLKSITHCCSCSCSYCCYWYCYCLCCKSATVVANQIAYKLQQHLRPTDRHSNNNTPKQQHQIILATFYKGKIRLPVLNLLYGWMGYGPIGSLARLVRTTPVWCSLANLEWFKWPTLDEWMDS